MYLCFVHCKLDLKNISKKIDALFLTSPYQTQYTTQPNNHQRVCTAYTVLCIAALHYGLNSVNERIVQ